MSRRPLQILGTCCSVQELDELWMLWMQKHLPGTIFTRGLATTCHSSLNRNNGCTNRAPSSCDSCTLSTSPRNKRTWLVALQVPILYSQFYGKSHPHHLFFRVPSSSKSSRWSVAKSSLSVNPLFWCQRSVSPFSCATSWPLLLAVQNPKNRWRSREQNQWSQHHSSHSQGGLIKHAHCQKIRHLAACQAFKMMLLASIRGMKSSKVNYRRVEVWNQGQKIGVRIEASFLMMSYHVLKDLGYTQSCRCPNCHSTAWIWHHPYDQTSPFGVKF